MKSSLQMECTRNNLGKYFIHNTHQGKEDLPSNHLRLRSSYKILRKVSQVSCTRDVQARRSFANNTFNNDRSKRFSLQELESDYFIKIEKKAPAREDKKHRVAAIQNRLTKDGSLR